MLLTNLESPTFCPAFALDEDLSAVGGKGTLRGLDIWADGDVSITDINDVTRTRTIAAPYKWVVQIKKVNSAGTTVDIANLDGLQ